MNQIRKRLTYANVMSSIAVFLVLGGAAVAASQLPKNSVGSKQLKRNAVNSSKVKDRSLLSKDFKSGQIPSGPQGAKGDTGADGVVQTGRWAGSIASTVATSAAWKFVGPTTTVTTNGAQRLTASGVAALGATAAGDFDASLCTQVGAATPVPFNSVSDYTIVNAETVRNSFAAANSFVPAAGTYRVGFCVKNTTTTLNDNDWATGWVIVTNN